MAWPVTFLQSSQVSNKPMFLLGTLNKKQSSSSIERRHQSSEAVRYADDPVKDKRSCSANDSGASSWHGKAFQVQRIPSELDFIQHSIVWSGTIYIDTHSEVLFAGKAEKILIFFPIFRCSGLNYRVLKSCKKGHGTVSL